MLKPDDFTNMLDALHKAGHYDAELHAEKGLGAEIIVNADSKEDLLRAIGTTYAKQVNISDYGGPFYIRERSRLYDPDVNTAR